jgi:oligopeptide/dipeptide ABC transporter ATP-binding protein
VAYAICDRIAIMYAGSIVELASADEIIHNPYHPYTKLLLEAVPPLMPDKTWGDTILEGEVAYYIQTPDGCKFQERCKECKDECKTGTKQLIEKSPGHFVACDTC